MQQANWSVGIYYQQVAGGNVAANNCKVALLRHFCHKPLAIPISSRKRISSSLDQVFNLTQGFAQYTLRLLAFVLS